MPTVVLQTEKSEHLGFLLLAGGEDLNAGSRNRQCILTGPPKSSDLFDHPISAARLGHLHKEHSASVDKHQDHLEVHVDVAATAELDLFIQGDAGSWVIKGQYGNASGKCKLLPERE